MMALLCLRPKIKTLAWRLALLATVLGCASGAAAARGDDPPTDAAPRVETSQPLGFDSLLQSQEAVVDVVVARRALGQARVRYASGRVTLLDVDSLVALLPDLTEPAAVRAALAAPDLDTHAEMICAADANGDDNRAACGIYRPAVAGVIFDDSRFRLDVLVNPQLLSVHPAAERAYLPAPKQGVSLVDQLGGSIAGSGGYASYGFQNRAILARGAGRIRNDLSYSSTYGLSVDALVAEVDRPGLRYSAGAMWVQGIELVGRRRLVGAGVQSQIDTRLDRTQIVGTPLIVSLPLRARVDILRDGRLLTSRNYDPGNQTLDTSTLPDGAYEVVLHIQEAGGAARDERRFFTKNAAIAGTGEPIFFAYVGMLGEDRRSAPLSITDTPFYQGGVARRFTTHLALDATVMGTDKTALLEIGGFWLGQAAQVRLAGLTSVHGDAGMLFQANSSGVARLNYTIDARRVWSKGGKPLIPLGDEGRRRHDVISIDRTSQLSAGSFTQVNAAISYDLKPGQIGVTVAYRDNPRERRSYGIGPSVYWPLITRAGMQVNLRGDMTLSNHGKAAFIGLSFQRVRASSAITASAGARSTSGNGAGSGTAVIGGIGGSWQRENVLGGDAALAAGVEQEANGTLVRGRADLNTARASFYADVAQPLAGDNGSTQYSVNFQTTAAVTAHGIALQGREQQDSVISVDVDGAAKGTPFEVLIDNAPRGTVRAGTPLTVPVPAYRQYAVRIRSTGSDLMQFDASARVVSVYPGTVSRQIWAAHRVVAMFGRIVWPDGAPLADAAVRTTGAIGSTDANGYFQIEAGTETMLSVRAADGRTCQLPLRARPIPQGYAPLGTLICSRPIPGTLIANSTR